jgi:hypothetical protein
MQLYELNRGDHFELNESDASDLCRLLPGVPGFGTLEYLGPDGMYGKVRCLDKDINDRITPIYDSGSPFFCLRLSVAVTKIG